MGTWLDGIEGDMTEETIENEQTGNMMLLEYQDSVFWSFTEELGNGFKILGRPDINDGSISAELWGPLGLYLYSTDNPCLDDALQGLDDLIEETDEDLDDCPNWYVPQILNL